MYTNILSDSLALSHVRVDEENPCMQTQTQMKKTHNLLHMFTPLPKIPKISPIASRFKVRNKVLLTSQAR